MGAFSLKRTMLSGRDHYSSLLLGEHVVGVVSACVNPEAGARASQAALELTMWLNDAPDLILQPPLPQCWGYRCLLPQLCYAVIGIETRCP